MDSTPIGTNHNLKNVQRMLSRTCIIRESKDRCSEICAYAR